MSNNTFLPGDYQTAIQYIETYDYLHAQMTNHKRNQEFDKAIAYHQNMIQSLNELQRLKNKKQIADLVLNHIRSEQQMEYVARQFRG